MSSVTDPYQPVERSLFLTRGILEALIPHQPRLVVQTRGPLVARDIDLLSQFRSLRVNVSIPTDSESVRVAFEPKSPTLEKRWEAVRMLQAAGISIGMCVTPTLPLEKAAEFARKLADAKATVLVVQDFHDSGGGFGADTSANAKELAHSLNWNTDGFRAFAEQVSRLTEVFEGEAGFFPPPS
jgi:DNA repair photolyase